MPLNDLEKKLCIVKFKIPESDINSFGASLPAKSVDDFILFSDKTYGYVINCQLLEYNFNGIWIYFHSKVAHKDFQKQELFVPNRYILSIQLIKEQNYKDAKTKPKIGF